VTTVRAQLLTGPAASGKTSSAVARALELATAGERVIVLTLPGQRAQWLERLAQAGASLGVEVTNLQNIAYRILDRMGENRSIVLNPGRVALTARVLENILKRNVNPGEARLYARAIAEFKRNLVAPLESEEAYQHILFQVFHAYQHELELGMLQDLDDVRIRTAQLLSTNPQALNAHLIIDGYRTFNPSELRVFCALASLAKTTLVTLPSGLPDTHSEAWAHPLLRSELERVASAFNAKTRYLHAKGKPWAGMPKTTRLETYANPVEEARGVLREIKQRLQNGTPSQDICILIPHPAIARVLEALGREYGVPIAPETSGSILETPNGRQLEALLRAPARDYPARDLRTLAALEPDVLVLAEKLEQNGIAAGLDAYALVCDDPNALAALERIKQIAQPPASGSSEQLIHWFETLLERHFKDASFCDTAKVIAREAARILGNQAQVQGSVFTDWVQSLLSSVTVAHEDLGRGVAVLNAEEASGRRFKISFVMGATDGAYKASDGEDFFIPEEQRGKLEELLANLEVLNSPLRSREGGSSDPARQRPSPLGAAPRARQVRLLGQESFTRDGGVVRHSFDDLIVASPAAKMATPYLTAGDDISREFLIGSDSIIQSSLQHQIESLETLNQSILAAQELTKTSLSPGGREAGGEGVQHLDIDEPTLEPATTTLQLPFRLNGLEDSQLYDAFTRADELLVVSYARAERGSSLRPHPRLVQLEQHNQKRVFATASPLELAALNASIHQPQDTVHQVSVRVARKATELERVAVCALKAWAEGLIPASTRGTGLVSGELLEGWTRAQRNNLWQNKGKNLSEVAPEMHRATLANLAPKFRAQLEQTVQENVPSRPEGSDIQLGYRAMIDDLEFVLDGVRIRKDPSGKVKMVEVYRVVKNLDDAYEEYMGDTRHREWWYANYWLEQNIPVVLWAWDLNHAPKRIMGFDKIYAQRRLAQAMTALTKANQTLQDGSISASSGFHCRYCSYRDLCREAI
jgi:superfamily I DNA/RNA helicase